MTLSFPPLELRCLYCSAVVRVPYESPEANGELNVFCPGGACEDRFAATGMTKRKEAELDKGAQSE